MTCQVFAEKSVAFTRLCQTVSRVQVPDHV